MCVSNWHVQVYFSRTWGMFTNSVLPVDGEDVWPLVRLWLEPRVPDLAPVLRSSEVSLGGSFVTCEERKSNPCPSMSLSLMKRSSSPHPPPLLMPVPPLPPPESWLLWKPRGESLLVLGVGDDRPKLWWVSWLFPGGLWIKSCTDMDFPRPLSTAIVAEQQLWAGVTRGSNSRLMCLLQDPSPLTQ